MSTVVLENKASIAAEIISVLSVGVIVEASEGPLDRNLHTQFRGLFPTRTLGPGRLRDRKRQGRCQGDGDNNAIMVVTLFGESDSEGFHTRRFSFGFESAEKTAESDFRLATLRASLSLATQTRLVSSGLGLDHWSG